MKTRPEPLGGMNSVQEALYYGVPLAMAPQAADQFWISARASELGAALVLDPPRMEPRAIRCSVAKILSATRYTAATARIAASLRAAGGHMRAASEIQRFIRRNAHALVQGSGSFKCSRLVTTAILRFRMGPSPKPSRAEPIRSRLAGSGVFCSRCLVTNSPSSNWLIAFPVKVNGVTVKVLPFVMHIPHSTTPGFVGNDGISQQAREVARSSELDITCVIGHIKALQRVGCVEIQRHKADRLRVGKHPYRSEDRDDAARADKAK